MCVVLLFVRHPEYKNLVQPPQKTNKKINAFIKNWEEREADLLTITKAAPTAIKIIVSHHSPSGTTSPLQLTHQSSSCVHTHAHTRAHARTTHHNKREALPEPRGHPISVYRSGVTHVRLPEISQLGNRLLRDRIQEEQQEHRNKTDAVLNYLRMKHHITSHPDEARANTNGSVSNPN